MRGVLAGLAIPLAMAAMAAPAARASEPPTVKTYLALGDSFAFGYQQERFEVNFPTESPAYFEEGYVNFFARKLRASRTEENKGLVIVNDGCPDETTDSLIGRGPLGQALDPEAKRACPYHFVHGLPLHNDLGRLSQLEDALTVLNPCFLSGGVCPPAHEVKVVTIDIGANDELQAVQRCEAIVAREFARKGKSKYGKTPEEAFRICVLRSSNETFAHIENNIRTVLQLIRSPAFGNYAGPIFFLGYYNPDSLLISGSDVLQAFLNIGVEHAVAEFGVKYINPMPVFNPSPEGGTKEIRAIGEPGLPGRLTEMGNQRQIELNDQRDREEGKPEAHAGDLHPTVTGYAVLARLAYASYP